MIVGVAGVVVTMLAMGFGGSWVFLYPLPFHSVGSGRELATRLFAASVLLVGVSILVWCGGDPRSPSLAPASHERGGSVGRGWARRSASATSGRCASHDDGRCPTR